MVQKQVNGFPVAPKIPSVPDQTDHPDVDPGAKA